jgi:protein-disulfide isomerase
MKSKTLYIAAAVALAAVVAGIALFAGSPGTGAAAGNREALVRPHSQTMGPADAAVQLVEFLDPACGTCAQFYPLVKKLAAEQREDIRLIVRYAPFHAGSDQVVKALEASRRQAKYWQALEALLASQNQWVINHKAQPDLIWGPLAGAGLDVERIKVDMQSPEIARVVAQDMADANTLGVAATPEFFVNGRPLPEFGFQHLRKLVEQELSIARARRAG